MGEMRGILTKKQKKKVAIKKMDMIIKQKEIKIHDMEKMIEMKKEAIDKVRKIQELIQHGK